MRTKAFAALVVALCIAGCGDAEEEAGTTAPAPPAPVITPLEAAMRDIPPDLREAHQREIECATAKAEAEGRRWTPTADMVRETTRRLRSGGATPGCGTGATGRRTGISPSPGMTSVAGTPSTGAATAAPPLSARPTR